MNEDAKQTGVSRGRRPFLSAIRFRIFLGCQLVLLLSYPYAYGTLARDTVFIFITIAVILTGLYAACRERNVLYFGFFLAVPASLGDLALYMEIAPWLYRLCLAFEIVLYFYVLFFIFKEVFLGPKVTADTIAGAISIYLLLGLVWSTIYTLLENVIPGSFHLPSNGETASPMLWPDLLFFSLTTLTTTGYGDILPANHHARSLASLEYIVGVLYIAIMVARLVNAYQSRSKNRR